MLLKQFRQLQELDQKLNEYYGNKVRRSTAQPLENQVLDATKLTDNLSDDIKFDPDKYWVHQKYTDLSSKWKANGFTIPALNIIQSKLERANEMLAEVSMTRPELYNRMSVILVPPTKKLAFSSALNNAADTRRFLHLSSEFMEAKFPKLKIIKSWRVLIAYTEPEGIYIGKPQQLLNEKRYFLAGYNAYTLGLYEYSAMVMQETKNFDESTCTALLKDCAINCTIVPIVKSDGNSYIFGAETAISAFGDVRFRPAIEVKDTNL